MDRSPEIMRAAKVVEERMREQRKTRRWERRIETLEMLSRLSPAKKARLRKALKLNNGDDEMHLYNCKTANSGYCVTKFTKDYEVESSYIVSAEGCDCPAGHRPICRHRTMLPFFLENEHVDDGWFFIWDTRQWLEPIIPEGLADQPNEIEPTIETPVDAQPAPPTDSAPVAPQTNPASVEGAGFRFPRPRFVS